MADAGEVPVGAQPPPLYLQTKLRPEGARKIDDTFITYEQLIKLRRIGLCSYRFCSLKIKANEEQSYNSCFYYLVAWVDVIRDMEVSFLVPSY